MNITTELVFNEFRWNGDNVIPTVKKYDVNERDEFALFVEIETNSLHLNHIGSIFKGERGYIYRFGIRKECNDNNLAVFFKRIEGLLKFICEVPDLHGCKITIGYDSVYDFDTALQNYAEFLHHNEANFYDLIDNCNFVTKTTNSFVARIEKLREALVKDYWVSLRKVGNKCKVVVKGYPATFNPCAIKSWIIAWRNIDHLSCFYNPTYNPIADTKIGLHINNTRSFKQYFPTQLVDKHWDEGKIVFGVRSLTLYSDKHEIKICRKCLMPKISGVCLCSNRSFYVDSYNWLMLSRDKRFRGLSSYEIKIDAEHWQIYNVSLPILILLNFYKIKYEDLAFYEVDKNGNEVLHRVKTRSDIIKFWKKYKEYERGKMK